MPFVTQFQTLGDTKHGQEGIELTAFTNTIRILATAVVVTSLTACSGGALFGSRGGEAAVRQATRTNGAESVAVNRYLWTASLDVLSFLPVEDVDPFTGVIVFGYGTPPGGSRAYRATVHIADPALDARSLHVSLQTRGGSVSEQTRLAIEDAILSRARQIRIQDRGL